MRNIMMRPSVISLVVLVIASSQQICTCNPMAVAQTGIKLAMTLFGLIQKDLNSIDQEKRNEFLYNKINELSTDFKDLKNSVMNSINALKDKVTEKSDELFKYIKDVQRLYKRFVHYFNNRDKYASTEILNFANVVTTVSLVEPLATIEKMHEALVDLDIKQESLVSIIAKNSTPSDIICSRGKSVQQFINELFEAVALTDFKGLMMILYSLNVKAHYENQTYAFRQDLEMQNYIERIVNTSNKVKENINTVSREIWKCNPAHQKLGTTYSKLQEIFQGYFVYQKDIPFYNGYHRRHCESIKDERFRCKTSVCKFQSKERWCTGHLRDCLLKHTDMQVCHSPEGSDRRYDWMKADEYVGPYLYGRQEGTCNRIQNLHRTRDHLAYTNLAYADVCFCNCESEGRKIDRYFSVKDVTSNIDQNKVITGLRIVKDNYVFHIQIQQGKLGPSGAIIDKPEWKKINSIPLSELLSDKVSTYHYRPHNSDLKYEEWVEFYKNDIVFPVSIDRKIVYLDDLEAPQGQLLTGIRFQFINWDMRLEIRSTPFDYATGQLKKEASKWIFNPNTQRKRKRVALESPDDPTRLGASNIFTHSNKIILFGLTDMVRDLSQYTIPFIDIQELAPTIPMPLSGAGIFHKGRKNSGGFLAMKIFHYNFARHL